MAVYGNHNPSGPISRLRRMAAQINARQHVQRGLARRRSRLNYLRHRNQIKRRAKSRYRRVRHSGVFHRQQRHRYLHPNQHRRIRASLGIPFWSLSLGWGEVTDIFRSIIQVSTREGIQHLPYNLFLLDSVFFGEDDIDDFFSLLDVEMGVVGSLPILEGV